MNFIRASLILLILIFSLSILFVFGGENSEKKIEGNWTEASWKYEKINNNLSLSTLSFKDEIKKEIYKNLIIHEAEYWKFLPNGKLILSNYNATNEKEKLHWSVKGRGHILELKHEDGRVENYHIELLTEDLMIIYFNFDIQTRGIVKITFVKN